MADRINIKHLVYFGDFQADLDARELRKHGMRVKLQDQPFQVLAGIAAGSGAN